MFLLAVLLKVLFLFRAKNSTASLQGQLQNVRDSVSKINEERMMIKKELEAKNQELQEKLRTINQVKKIGRRYKTQYDELKVKHDTVMVFLLALI